MDFDSYVRASGPRLLRIAWLLTGNHAQAEDLLQAAYVRVLPKWGSISRYDDPDAYLRRTLVNTRTSLWRRTRHEQPFGSVPEVVTGDGTRAVDDVDLLVRALGRLGKRQRQVVVLRYYADPSEREVADALGINIGTVKSQSSKGLQTLRELLGPRTPPAAPVNQNANAPSSRRDLS